MGIFERAQMVMISNFNALLNKLEEPGRDLALLLSEMKEQILSAQRDLIKLMGESKIQQAKALEYKEEILRWEKRAELAVRQGDDTLAREALSQKRRLLEEQQRCATQGAEQRQVASAMKVEIERMKQKLLEYGQRQHITATQVTMARAGGSVEGLGQAGAARPFDELRRLEATIETSEAEAAANAELEDTLSRTSLGTMTRNELDARFLELETQQSMEIQATMGSEACEVEGTKEPQKGDTDAKLETGEDAIPSGSEASPRVRVRVEP